LNEGALKDVSPDCYRFEIEVKPPSTGGPFIPIKDLVDIYTQEDKSIEHKAGQVLLIDFWETWNPPC
jgi:thiol-disulfide isomerase/thioredoxin